MSDKFSRDILKRNVAQICQTIGWNGINTTPLEVLVQILEKYIKTLGSEANRYAEEFNRTEPNLHDLGLVFRDLHINLPELNDYIQNVPSVPSAVTVYSYPKPKEPSLNFLKPGSHEVVTRPVHIHEYLPPIFPDKETPVVADVVEIHQNGIEGPTSPEISVTDSPDKSNDVFKRPGEPLLAASNKKTKLKLDGEESHTREISSVMMTMSGFLSPAREGKLPEAKVPFMVSDKSHVDKHKTNHSIIPSEKKSKKSKLVNGKIMKSKRKDKHKGESKHKSDPRIAQMLHHKRPTPNHIVTQNMQVPVPMMDSSYIKKEQLDPMSRHLLSQGKHPYSPSKKSEKKNPTIPVPRLIPKNKSPISSLPLIPTPIMIKQEKLDEEEKLASQPDRSKVNIFKRISNKGKDDKQQSEYLDKICENLHNKAQSEIVRSDQVSMNNNTEPFVEDIPKNIDLTTNEVISLDDESIDFRPSPIPEPPKPQTKTIEQLPPFPINPLLKTKKEKKHKEKKEKDLLKAAKMHEKLIKKMAAANKINEFPPTPKIPKPKKIPKYDAKRMAQYPMPMFPNMPIPRPGLIPAPGRLPPGDLFTAFVNNPAMRDFPYPNPNMLANPFAMTGTHIPGPSHGSTKPLLMGHSSKHSKQPHNVHQILRRPDLDVFPLHNDADRKHQINPSTSITIKEKHKQTVPNIIQKHKKHSKDNHPKPELVNKMPLIQPDVTIELNPPPVIKTEPKSYESPSPPKLQPEEVREPPIIDPVVVKQEPIEDKPDKKKEKQHKKEKKDKDLLKHKKKKEKKEKHKEKAEKKKEAEDSLEVKEKVKKEKKEKRKDREKELTPLEGIVPKLTLKIGSASPMPPSSPDIVKLNIKPVLKKDDEPSSSVSEERTSPDPSRSPELAQISALVTRPPKQKHKHNHLEQEVKVEPSSSPPRKHKDKSKYKRILIKPIAKKNQVIEDDIIDSLPEEPPSPAAEPPPAPLTRNTPYYIDDVGNKVWVCPACTKPDNGTPMIGCDGCDCWYHWVCVGITKEPGAAEDWFCRACDAKRAAAVSTSAAGAGGINSGKKRGRKPRERV